MNAIILVQCFNNETCNNTHWLAAMTLGGTITPTESQLTLRRKKVGTETVQLRSMDLAAMAALRRGQHASTVGQPCHNESVNASSVMHGSAVYPTCCHVFQILYRQRDSSNIDLGMNQQ